MIEGNIQQISEGAITFAELILEQLITSNDLSKVEDKPSNSKLNSELHKANDLI